MRMSLLVIFTCFSIRFEAFPVPCRCPGPPPLPLNINKLDGDGLLSVSPIDPRPASTCRGRRAGTRAVVLAQDVYPSSYARTWVPPRGGPGLALPAGYSNILYSLRINILVFLHWEKNPLVLITTEFTVFIYY